MKKALFIYNPNAGKELLQKLQPAVKEKATFLYEKEQTFEAVIM